jgi:hypothetical protein
MLLFGLRAHSCRNRTTTPAPELPGSRPACRGAVVCLYWCETDAWVSTMDPLNVHSRDT